jgi:NAD(P)-dependent dehydrogenase (short-subunit alcohol dehydrogenase family)
MWDLSIHLYYVGALNQLTRNLATEWATNMIRVNGIAAGFVTTDMIKDVSNRLA